MRIPHSALIISFMGKIFHRKIIGILLLLLAPVCLISSLFVPNKPQGWWYTLCDTYYVSPAFAIIFSLAGLLIILYQYENPKARLINILTGISGLCLVIFPCSNMYGLERVGIFQLQNSVSSVIHTAFSVCLLITSLACIQHIFKKAATSKEKTFFSICIIIMMVGGVFFILTKLHIFPGWVKFIAEQAVTFPFAISWLVTKS